MTPHSLTHLLTPLLPPTLLPLPPDEGDEVRVKGSSLPYSRYFSYQTYNIPEFMSQASVRDVDVIASTGPNLFTNLTAAVLQETQGT